MMKHGLEKRGLGRSTLTSTIPSAVSNIFRYTDVNITSHPIIREAKRTVKRLTKPSVSKLPVTTAHLSWMAYQAPSTFIGTRNMFMMILMFLGFLRESEVTQLKPTDVWEETVDGKIVLFIYVLKAKNDQFSTGHTIVVGGNPESSLCPIRWYRAYKRFPKGTYLFRQANKHMLGLAAATPNAIIKSLLVSINVDPNRYGSHSLRRGGVTAAVAAGINILVLARHGNWRSEAIYAYVSQSMYQRLSVSHAILGSSVQGPLSKLMY